MDMLLHDGRYTNRVDSCYASGNIDPRVAEGRVKHQWHGTDGEWAPSQYYVDIHEIRRVTIMISFDGFAGRNPNFDDDSTLAIHHRGFVVALTPAIQQSLDMKASYVLFIHGSISANGERREGVYSCSETPEGSFLAQELVNSYQPIDLFPTIKLSTPANFSGNGIEIHQDILIKDQIFLGSRLRSIFNSLGQLYVTDGCDHSYYTEFRPTYSEDHRRHGPRNQGPQTRIVRQGLFSGPMQEQSSEATLAWYLQPVDQNTCGQWIACGIMARDNNMKILQRNTCLQCTCERTEQLYDLLHHGRCRTICVIPGRLKDEPME